VSRAALWGGTTTMIDFAALKPDRHGDESSSQSIREAIEERDKVWAGKCYCDYSYHVMLRGKIPPATIGELKEVVQAGYPTVKIFTTDITPSRAGRMIRFGEIWEIFKVLAREGGLGVIHAEDNDLVMHMYEKLFRENRTGFEHLAEVHSALSEDLSFRRIIRLAEQVEGMALYMMHVSAASGVQAIAESRARGFPMYGETLHQYLLYSEEDYRKPNGQIYHTYPSLKSKRDQQGLWDGLEHGNLHSVGTDEVCCNLSVKVRGNRIDDTTGGNAGVEPRVAVMYTETVENRGYSLEKFVDVVSTNAARILGLYPRKGAIAVGSDADITVLDTSRRRKVRLEDLHEADYSPWEGKEVGAWPSVTVLRGKVMVADGKFHGDLKDGRYLKRKIPDVIRTSHNSKER
jgi:dihydropyrimidinase